MNEAGWYFDTWKDLGCWGIAVEYFATREEAEDDGVGESCNPPGGPCSSFDAAHAAALLQGFPEGWVFAGRTKKSRWAQIGQAVPYAVALALGRSVAAALSGTRSPAARERA